MVENETPHNGSEEASSNVIALPAITSMLRCSICGTNISEAAKETKMEPSFWSAKDPSDGEDVKYFFCPTCNNLRFNDIRGFIDAHEDGVAEEEFSDDFTDAKEDLLSGAKLYKTYESKENGVGEKIRVISWRKPGSGVSAAVTIVKNEREKGLFFNLSEMSIYDFKISMEYVRIHFQNEFKLFRPVPGGGRISLKKDRLPIFRGRLMGMDVKFRLYDDGDSVGVAIGFADISVPKEDFDDFGSILSASVAFFESDELSDLEEFKEHRAKSKDKKLRRVGIWSERNKTRVVEALLPSGRRIVVSGGPDVAVIDLDGVRLSITCFDLTDISQALQRLPSIMEASMLSQKIHKIGVVRKERYAWLSNYDEITFEFVMKDLGWCFEFDKILNAYPG